MSQKILIVGGSGNLGNKICNFLIKTNNKLVNLDKRKIKNLNKISFIKCDLTKKISKKKLPRDINIIIFSAGYIGGIDSRDDNFIDKYFKLNLYSLSNLLESIEISKLKKIIFFSSEQVYGDNQININNKKNTFFEPKPKNYYGASKLMAEKYLNYFYSFYNKKFGIDILRVPRVIDLSENTLFYKLIKSCSLRKKINITNNREKFNFVFVDDFLSIISRTITQKKKLFRILDIGSKDYKSFSIIDIIKLIDQKINTKTKTLIKNEKFSHNPFNLKINYNYSYKSLKQNSKISVKKMIELIRDKYGLK